MKVSIVTICKNSEKTIERTIKSVINQTYHNIEYIIVDGLSTDRTMEIVENYKKFIAKIICEKDSGIYNAMNKGIEATSGDIVGIINSDDWYEENAIEKVVDAFEKENVDVVYGDTYIWQNQYNNILSKSKGIDDNIWISIPFAHPSMFAKKNIYEKYGLYDENYKIAADCKWILNSYIRGINFRQISEALANFSVGGISTTKEYESLFELKNVYLELIDNCTRKDECLFSINMKLARTAYNRVLAQNPEILNTFFDSSDILYGAGKNTCRVLEKLDDSIKCGIKIADSNASIWGTYINNCKIDDINELCDISFNRIIIMISNEQQSKIVYDYLIEKFPNCRIITFNELINEIYGIFLGNK